MPGEQFSHSETRPLFQKLERLSQRSGVSRGAAFEDFLTAVVCALAAETKEDEYLAMVERHKSGVPGQRGIDLIPEMFAELIAAMDSNESDLLGDLFQGSITYGESGQYFSPEPIARLLAELSVNPEAEAAEGRPVTINDCCCGTGRMLLEASRISPQSELVGVDIDARCVKITAINLALRGRYGWVLCGNSLSGETKFAYRIGSFFHESPNGRRRGVIRDVLPEHAPVTAMSDAARSQTQDLFADQKVRETASPKDTLQIMEIPKWALDLERIASGSGDGQTAGEQHDAPTTPSEDDPPEDSGHLSQQCLF